MRTLEYGREVRPLALLEELVAAGVPVMAVRPPAAPGVAPEQGGAPVTIDLDVAADDASQDAATDAVVAAHDPQAIDQAASTARHTYDDAVALLKQYRHATSPTQAQTVSAVKALIDVTKKLNADLREQGEVGP